MLPCCTQLPAVLHPQDTSSSKGPLAIRKAATGFLLTPFPLGCGQMHFQSLPVGLLFSPIWFLWSKKFGVSPAAPASIVPWLVECTERKSNQAWLSTAAPSKPHPACGYHSPESCSLWVLPVKGSMEKSLAEVTELQRQRNHKAHKGTSHP